MKKLILSVILSLASLTAFSQSVATVTSYFAFDHDAPTTLSSYDIVFASTTTTIAALGTAVPFPSGISGVIGNKSVPATASTTTVFPLSNFLTPALGAGNYLLFVRAVDKNNLASSWALLAIQYVKPPTIPTNLRINP